MDSDYLSLASIKNAPPSTQSYIFCPFPICCEGRGQPKLFPLSSLAAVKTDPSFPDPTLFSHFLLASFSGTGYSTPKSFRGCTGCASLRYKPAQKRDEKRARGLILFEAKGEKRFSNSNASYFFTCGDSRQVK